MSEIDDKNMIDLAHLYDKEHEAFLRLKSKLQQEQARSARIKDELLKLWGYERYEEFEKNLLPARDTEDKA